MNCLMRHLRGPSVGNTAFKIKDLVLVMLAKTLPKSIFIVRTSTFHKVETQEYEVLKEAF